MFYSAFIQIIRELSHLPLLYIANLSYLSRYLPLCYGGNKIKCPFESREFHI